jgi:hypothetical protein
MLKVKPSFIEYNYYYIKFFTFLIEFGYGSIAILFVSGLALLGILILPCFKKQFYDKIIKILTALAVGTLFSDAMLHILPEVIIILFCILIVFCLYFKSKILLISGVEPINSKNETFGVPGHIIKIIVAMFGNYLIFYLI